MAFGGGSFTTNCLDDIPFKLGPNFRPPAKVVLPPDFQHSVEPKALKVEYTFEVEEAVLKWSAEKERQRLELEAAKLRQPDSNTSQDAEYTQSDSSEPEQPIYENAKTVKEPLYENPSMLVPQPAPRPIVQRKPKDDSINMMAPNPLIANISADILQPVPSYSSDENEEKNIRAGAESNEIDLRWFEKEDDPFNNLELQTINVMDELASVLEETKKSSPVPSSTSNVVENGKVGCDETKSHTDPVLNNFNGNLVVQDDNEGESDGPEYENVELKMMDLKNSVNVGQSHLPLTNLPPIPPRRDLVGNQPLPPIGHSTSEPSFSGGSSIKTVNNSASTDNINDQIGQSQTGVKMSFQSPEVPKVMSSRRVALPKPPRTFTYSRHDMNDSSDLEVDIGANNVNISEPNYDNVPQINIGNNLNVQFTNNDQPDVEKSVRNSDDELNFDQHHFDDDNSSNTVKDTSRPRPAPRRPPAPPPRPSSQQSWNRYSPLPPTGSGSATDQSPRDGASVDLYNQLSLEAQSSVDKLAMMGFPKDRVVRAVDKLGRDEKEVVEYLCLVDQLIEKGYSIHHSETALIMFKNSMSQACTYLELFTQMQELGFNGDKIKEALVNTNNDREKTLDILTASS